MHYKKQALSFAEGAGTATISYATVTEELRSAPFVPSRILEQYAVVYEPDDASSEGEGERAGVESGMAEGGPDLLAAAHDHLAVVVAEATLTDDDDDDDVDAEPLPEPPFVQSFLREDLL